MMSDTQRAVKAVREGFEAQRKVGIPVDWFTWQIAWHDALFSQCNIIGEAALAAAGAEPDWYVKQVHANHMPEFNRINEFSDGEGGGTALYAAPFTHEADKPMMKTHSREWFLQQIAEAKNEIAEQWPSWMKEGNVVAVASFPPVGEDNQMARVASTAPEGWKLIPVDPTDDMIDAGCDCEPVTRWGSAGEILRERYKAMIAAAFLTSEPEIVGAGDLSFEQAAEIGRCKVPPSGWTCSREKGHSGPCAASPADDSQPNITPAMERAFSSDAMGRRDEFALADRHSETPKLCALLGINQCDGINYDARVKLEKALADPLPRASDAATPRPTDDALWDQTLQERDIYHEWADKLANGVSEYFNIEIGEHSNLNNPWSVALDIVKSAPGNAAQPVADDTGAERTYTTKAGEAVAGIALRQCGNEAEWRHILACNPQFADMLPHEYFPVGTVLQLPTVDTGVIKTGEA